MTLDRSTYIGSSDAAPIAGLSPWGSPLSVWMDKVGMSDPKPESLRMWLGSRLEPILLELFEQKTGETPARYPQDGPPILHPKYPFIGCHPDAEGLELKTSQFAREWGDDMSVVTIDDMSIPLHYFIQNQHTMSVMAWETIQLAVLIGHDDFRRFTIPANPDVQANLIDAEVELWGYVERKEPPPEDDPESRKAYLRKRFPNPVEDMRPATPEDNLLLDQWREAKRAEKSAKAALDEAADRVKGVIGDAAGIVAEATWTGATRKSLDTAVLRERLTDMGRTDILDEATKVSKYRTLRDKRRETDK